MLKIGDGNRMTKMIKDNEYGIEYELKYIDSTHVSLGGTIWHIGQLIESPFYNEIIEYINECKIQKEF
jgi:hypothetical protein